MTRNPGVEWASRRARVARAWREGLPRPLAGALGPATLVYRAALALRRAAYAGGLVRTRALPCRVVAVGNLTVGGTGKTPLVELLARALVAQGRRAVILSRGYGRRRADEVRAVSDGREIRLTAADAGDEPVLLARRLPGVPVVVGRDRFRAGAWAVARFAPDALLLDDGFQHMRLRKDVEVVCLDARAPWGHGGLLPRGSLREPPAALGRAHLVVLTHAGPGRDLGPVLAEIRKWAPVAPAAVAVHEAEAVEELGQGVRHSPEVLRGRRAVAFAGIALPDDFRASVAEQGVDVRDFVPFPDHYPYEPGDLLRLWTRAGAVGAELLLTTEKDAVRLPPPGPIPVWVLGIRLRLVADAGWWEALEARLTRRP